MRIDIDNVGDIGVIADQPAVDIPYNAWSDARNFRFYNGAAEPCKGQSDFFEATQSISVIPIWVSSLITNNKAWAVFGDESRVFCGDMSAGANMIFEISSATYSATTSGWQDTRFGKILVVNNGTNCPQQWGTSATEASSNVKLITLQNWSVTASVTCKFIRSFKNYLVAGDITKAGTRNRQLLKWSHPASYGDVPSSWDYADATKDAGLYELAQTSDVLIDCLPLNDTNIIYKANSTWGMQFIGAPNIFRFYPIFPDNGMVAVNCAAVVKGNSHAVFGENDFYVHNGQSLNSILTGKIKDWIYSNLDGDTYRNSYVINNRANNEVWFCFPMSGNTYPTMAAIWNYENNTTSLRELPTMRYMHGVSGAGAREIVLDGVPYRSGADYIIGCPPSSTLYLMENTYLNDSSLSNPGNNRAIQKTLERRAIPLGRQTISGGIKNDDRLIKSVKRITPQITGSAGASILISVGSSARYDETPTWSSTTFTLGTDRWINTRVSGQFISIKFESSDAAAWKLTGYGVDFDILGDR